MHKEGRVEKLTEFAEKNNFRIEINYSHEDFYAEKWSMEVLRSSKKYWWALLRSVLFSGDIYCFENHFVDGNSVIVKIKSYDGDIRSEDGWEFFINNSDKRRAKREYIDKFNGE